MAKATKNRSIKIFFRFVTIFPIAFINAFIIVGTLLTFFYARTDNMSFFLALIIFVSAMIAIYIVYTVFYFLNDLARRVGVIGGIETG